MASKLVGLRDFHLLWVGGLFASVSAQLSTLALPLLVLRQTGSTVAAGVISVVSIGALVVSMLPGGVVADAVERRRLMQICDIGSLLAVTVLVVTILNGAAPLLLVLLVAGAGAVINCFYLPASMGLLRAVVSPDLLGAAASRMQARSSAARLAGPLIGGALFTWGPVAPFVAEAACLLLSSGCLLLMRTRSKPERAAASNLGEQLVAGLRFLWQQPYLRTILAVFGLGMNAAFSAMMFTALALASDNGSSGLGGGMVVSLAAAGSLVGALLAPRFRPEGRTALLIIGTCWLCALAAAILAVVHPPILIGVLASICMAAAALASNGFLTSLLLATPEEKVGRVQSAASFVSSLVQPLGPLAAGVLLSAGGAAVTFGVLAGVFTLCAVVVSAAPSVRARRTMDASTKRGANGPAGTAG